MQVSATESVADDLKECHIGVHEAQALNQNTQSLINLASEAIGNCLLCLVILIKVQALHLIIRF